MIEVNNMFKQETIKVKTGNGMKRYMKIPINPDRFGYPRVNWQKPPDGWILCECKYVNGEYVETAYPVISQKLISKIWKNVINKLPKDANFYTTDIAREIIKNMKYEDINKYIDGKSTAKTIMAQWKRTNGYNNINNEFEYGTLMGNRASNFNLVYFPLKAMHTLRLIHYRRSPTIRRIKINIKFRMK